ncbi:MAG: thiamine diphosphokinase [Acidaminococcus sp.]|jgi:thiamine pyrophosphokinase|nr:thiamine diphosphokinase [Acidaminococcus sp.]MCI2100745.1 thiamine diphosphokinase [Acidaminococcus sp.]MCI2115066.1 thiamine diphosphokinase [Acidaminococcus sp.]MCI2117142.1 thiamine diphosphokinase [Acidaminococcus sp.]
MEVVLPQGRLVLSRTADTTLVLMAGGRGPDPQWLKKAAGTFPLYAADRGSDYCIRAGLWPIFACGDRDSGHAGSWEQMKAHGCKVKTFLVNKNDTDLSLLLQELPERACILASGIWGGRADHLYANMLTLLTYQRERGGTVIMADDREIMVFLEKGDQVSWEAYKMPKAVSLLPFSDVTTVSISGVRWPLDHAELTRRNPYAVSNQLAGKLMEAGCDSGVAGLYLTYKE